uniref:Pancreatic trypsin inhibitor n=1 Tax=Rhipicephalus zambeziensis TaxID=60191 RepID=A0A224Y4W3_9ACAR
MYKSTLVVIVVLSYAVPLLAWPKFPFHWFKWPWPQPTTPRPNPWQRHNYTVFRPSCSGGNGKYIVCVYPKFCSCPQPTNGGYIRYAEEHIRWFYNNRTKRCESKAGIPGGCNNFENQGHCMWRCEIPLMQKRRRQSATRQK